MPSTWLPVITGSWLTPQRSISSRATHSLVAGLSASVLRVEHYLRSGRGPPVGPEYFLDAVTDHQPDSVYSTIGYEAAATGAEDVFVHQLLQGQVAETVTR